MTNSGPDRTAPRTAPLTAARIREVGEVNDFFDYRSLPTLWMCRKRPTGGEMQARMPAPNGLLANRREYPFPWAPSKMTSAMARIAPCTRSEINARNNVDTVYAQVPHVICALVGESPSRSWLNKKGIQSSRAEVLRNLVRCWPTSELLRRNINGRC